MTTIWNGDLSQNLPSVLKGDGDVHALCHAWGNRLKERSSAALLISLWETLGVSAPGCSGLSGVLSGH